MAKETQDYWPDEPEEGGDKDCMTIQLLYALGTATELASRQRHRFLTVEHVMLHFIEYLRQRGLISINLDEQADLQTCLFEHVITRNHARPPAEPDGVSWSWNLNRALLASIQAAHPHKATVLDFVYAVFRQDTFVTRLLKRYGMTNVALSDAVRRQSR